MKVAVLMLVHKNINQVVRLIKRLEHKNVDIYIHIDSKSNLTNEDIKLLKKLNYGHIYISEERFNIYLFSYEMVEATLCLINNAYQNSSIKGFKYSYYILLSGQDYPLKNINEILMLLKQSYPKPFIDVTPCKKGNWVYSSYSKSSCFKKLRGQKHIKANKINNRILKFLYKSVNIFPFKILSYFRISPYKKLISQGVKLYGGSQWWILSDICIESIIGILEKERFYKEFKYVGSPDETFFQTCIMNTELSKYISVNSWDETLQNCMMFTCFNNTGHPDILLEKDYNKIIMSNKLFARKFDCNIDDTILDKIDEIIKN